MNKTHTFYVVAWSKGKRSGVHPVLFEDRESADAKAGVMGLRGFTYKVRPVQAEDRRGRDKRQLVTHGGRVYESQTALAKALGVSVSTVSHHLNRHGHTDHIGVGVGSGTRTVLQRGRTITICGHTFPSVSEAARYLGVSESCLRNRFTRKGGGLRLIEEDFRRRQMEDAAKE